MVKCIVTGDATSHGECEGVARVVRDLKDVLAFKQGEILVATNTSPLFNSAMMKAAAMVVETGGALSHTSIVARELGVPAIVNAANVTALIQTGQRVRVRAWPDGGTVHDV